VPVRPAARPAARPVNRPSLAVLVALCSTGLALPAAGQADAAGSGCLRPPSSLTGSPNAIRHLAGGVIVRTWQGPNRRGWQVSLSAAQTDLAHARVVSAVPPRLGVALPTSALISRSGGIIGVNGDYFDYDSFGAAVTPGPQVRGAIPQRVPTGPSPFVGVGLDGRLRAGALHAAGTVTLPPRVPGAPVRRFGVAAVNPESLPSNGIVVVNSYRSRNRPTAGWEVVLRGGTAIWGGRRADYGAGGRYGGRDLLLVGTGSAAVALSTLPWGARVGVSYRAVAEDGAPVTEAVGRGAVVLRAGVNVAHCDGSGRTSRARTLVGWDAAGRVWLLVVNSGGATLPVGGPGLTYYETAEVARGLGVKEAVLLDGGGSSTLAGGRPGVSVRLDAPSWTTQRPVPNGLALLPRP
jgi:hypothetical protein